MNNGWLYLYVSGELYACCCSDWSVSHSVFPVSLQVLVCTCGKNDSMEDRFPSTYKNSYPCVGANSRGFFYSSTCVGADSTWFLLRGVFYNGSHNDRIWTIPDYLDIQRSGSHWPHALRRIAKLSVSSWAADRSVEHGRWRILLNDVNFLEQQRNTISFWLP